MLFNCLRPRNTSGRNANPINACTKLMRSTPILMSAVIALCALSHFGQTPLHEESDVYTRLKAIAERQVEALAKTNHTAAEVAAVHKEGLDLLERAKIPEFQIRRNQNLYSRMFKQSCLRFRSERSSCRSSVGSSEGVSLRVSDSTVSLKHCIKKTMTWYRQLLHVCVKSRTMALPYFPGQHGRVLLGKS